jgi:signal transduction histidine kinase
VLRSPEQYRRAVSRRNWGFDIALVLAVGVLGQVEVWLGVGSTHRQGPLWVQSALYATTALLLTVRRVRPLACLAAMVVVSLVEFAAVGSPEGFAVTLAPLIATCTAARRLEWRRSWAALLLSLVLPVGWAVFDPVNLDWSDVASSLIWLAPSLIAWLVGTLLRLGRLNIEQRRVNREQQAAQAVTAERTRIARELHDVVGHSVSVMTIQAAAVRRRLAPEQTVERRALEAVETAGREALAEMRRMVEVLRRPEAATALEPQPGLGQLDRLLEKFRSAGLPVSVTVSGTARELAPGLDLTAYRLVQEGLTNTLRHARDTQHAEVELDYGAERVQVVVRDDGAATGAEQPGRTGAGLLGLRERVSLYGGSLEARARPEGGFELVATLPVVSG